MVIAMMKLLQVKNQPIADVKPAVSQAWQRTLLEARCFVFRVGRRKL
jgi:hypothetical protein